MDDCLGNTGNQRMDVKWTDLFFCLREKREWRRKNVVSVV